MFDLGGWGLQREHRYDESGLGFQERSQMQLWDCGSSAGQVLENEALPKFKSGNMERTMVESGSTCFHLRDSAAVEIFHNVLRFHGDASECETPDQFEQHNYSICVRIPYNLNGSFKTKQLFPPTVLEYMLSRHVSCRVGPSMPPPYSYQHQHYPPSPLIARPKRSRNLFETFLLHFGNHKQ